MEGCFVCNRTLPRDLLLLMSAENLAILSLINLDLTFELAAHFGCIMLLYKVLVIACNFYLNIVSFQPCLSAGSVSCTFNLSKAIVCRSRLRKFD